MLQLIIESVPVRVFWKDSDLRYLGCNTLFARDAGLSHPEQILGKDDFAMGWREQADLYRTDDRQVMESRRPKINMVEPQTTPAGATIWLNTSKVPLQMPDGEVFGVLGVYEDITERKLAEEELHDTRERLELALKGADMGSWDWNVQAGAVIYNQRWAEMLGYSLEEIKPLFSSWEQLIHPDDLPRFMEALNAHLEGKTPFYESEHRLRHKSGEWLWVLDKGKVIERDAQGQPLRACGTQLDITGRKQAEAEQLRFSKLESLAILAGGIAHDFNNILTAIIGNLSLAMLDIHKKEHLRERLNEAERACLQAQTLSRQLLTFAKGGAPIKELVAVEKLVIDSGSFACSGSKARCEFSFPENLWAAEADPGQTSQVFQNLIINAIQAMPAGGTIKVRGENLMAEAKSDFSLTPGRYIKISIEDQGVGIPANFLPKIFDPYFTTKQTGSGLGLATAYSIVKNHHGHISVESELGVGTTFHVYLPAADRQMVEPPEKAGRVLAGLGNILVMDDEEMVRHILDKMLGHLGYKAKVARDGEEAIELFTAAQAKGTPFDAVILDLTVPGGLGGRETMARLFKIDPRIKAIVSSGYSDDPIMADFREYGFSGVIAKPYRISELSKILQEVLAPGDNRTSDHKK
jgi:PAS domain S-box-containing protein